MDKTTDQTIENFYNNILNVIKEDGKGKKLKAIPRPLYPLAKKSPNNVIKILTKAGIKKNLIDSKTLQHLQKKDFIFEFNNEDLEEIISLNVFGIFYLEEKKKVLTINDVLGITNTEWLKRLPKMKVVH